jgi:glycine/D-amino acid oxidase-like deaminating enzyme
MLSLWEKESFLRYDFIVVGGGMIGLSTAVALKERNPSASVLVLERGLFPAGASTKNVGHLSVSTLTEVLADREELGDDALLDVISKRWRGMRLLRERYGDTALGYEPVGGYELFRDEEIPAVDHIDTVNRFLRPLFSSDVFQVRDDLLARFGFNRAIVKKLVLNPIDGHVRTGKVLTAVLARAGLRGVRILTGAEVASIEEDTSGVSVRVGEIEFRAGAVAVCTNSWISRLVPSVGVTPARGQVFVTEPVAGLPWRGTFNFDTGYYYFRDVGDRVIVGGGRHTDRETETTHEQGINAGIHERLEGVLRDIVLPGRTVKIEMRWSGIMGFSRSRLPVVKRTGARTAVGFGCNSMGLVMGSVIGDETAALLS